MILFENKRYYISGLSHYAVGDNTFGIVCEKTAKLFYFISESQEIKDIEYDYNQSIKIYLTTKVDIPYEHNTIILTDGMCTIDKVLADVQT